MMKEYLIQKPDSNDFDLVSVMDELPLWSAPFGMKLLDTIEMKKNMNVLDIGCGSGFPLVEIAERLGDSCKVYGIDPWERALERVRLKMKVYGIKNIELIKGYAESIPLENDFCDLVVSNNGINNVQDMVQTIKECYRVCKQDAQMVVTLNLEGTMIEFYNILQEILEENHLYEELQKMKDHIYSKRKPVSEIKNMFEECGFNVKNINYDSFKLRFADGTSLLNHHLIKFWFLDSWKNIVKEDEIIKIIDIVEFKLNKEAQRKDEFDLTVPFVTIDCRKI